MDLVKAGSVDPIFFRDLGSPKKETGLQDYSPEKF
jgi:hypothetical protein